VVEDTVTEEDVLDVLVAVVRVVVVGGSQIQSAKPTASNMSDLPLGLAV